MCIFYTEQRKFTLFLAMNSKLQKIMYLKERTIERNVGCTTKQRKFKAQIHLEWLADLCPIQCGHHTEVLQREGVLDPGLAVIGGVGGLQEPGLSKQCVSTLGLH